MQPSRNARTCRNRFGGASTSSLALRVLFLLAFAQANSQISYSGNSNVPQNKAKVRFTRAQQILQLQHRQSAKGKQKSKQVEVVKGMSDTNSLLASDREQTFKQVIDVKGRLTEDNDNRIRANVESAVDEADQTSSESALSHLYHQRVYGISVGSILLSAAILALLTFVVYAKHRSTQVYRVSDEYEASFDRMLAVMDEYPHFRPIFEHRGLNKYVLDDSDINDDGVLTRLALMSDEIHALCDECEAPPPLLQGSGPSEFV